MMEEKKVVVAINLENQCHFHALTGDIFYCPFYKTECMVNRPCGEVTYLDWLKWMEIEEKEYDPFLHG